MTRLTWTRRAFAAAAATCCTPTALAAADRRSPLAIDCHHHFYPPVLLAALRRNLPAGEDPIMRIVGAWTPEKSLAEMDAGGVGKAVLSLSLRVSALPLTVPAVNDLVRECNVYAADLHRRHPDRFGWFANLPMPHVRESLTELQHSLDVLGADGVTLITSYGNSYLGAPEFAPLLAELDRRAAVVYVHPSAPQCCAALMPVSGMLEYPFDTGRTFLSLLLSGSLARYRRIRWILSHAGGPLPALSGRIAALTANRDMSVIAPLGVEAELKRLYYETANSAYRPAMAALLAVIPATQVLFGSDYPYVGVPANSRGLQQIPLTSEQRSMILHRNAERLLPTLAKSAAPARGRANRGPG